MLNNIISLCVRNGFITKINLRALKIDHLRLGPVGLLLQKNVENEWFHNIVINKDYTVFLSTADFRHTYEYAKKMCGDKLPFGIAEVEPKNGRNVQYTCEHFVDSYNKRMKDLTGKEDGDFNLEDLLVDENRATLRCTMFVAECDGVSFFHQWQRQRRIWWRKFSPNPGRYHLSDIKMNEDNHTQNVDIFVKYPWGKQHLESLTLHQKEPNISGILDDKFKNDKPVAVNTVVSNIDLNTLVLNTIFDAYDDSVYKTKIRTLLRFHRKMAPYKISCTVSASTTAVFSELTELALYLTRQLRTNHICTLFLPNISKLEQDKQWEKFDQMGIPYNVLLKESTLKDGILHLRNRNTTLKEEVHVSELVSYVEQLFKNY